MSDPPEPREVAPVLNELYGAQLPEVADYQTRLARENDALRANTDRLVAEAWHRGRQMRDIEVAELRAENARLKHYEADFKKMTIMHCGPKCSCVHDQREALATAEAEVARLRQINAAQAHLINTQQKLIAALPANPFGGG